MADDDGNRRLQTECGQSPDGRSDTRQPYVDEANGAQHGNQRLLFGAFALGRWCQVGVLGGHITVGVGKPERRMGQLFATFSMCRDLIRQTPI